MRNIAPLFIFFTLQFLPGMALANDQCTPNEITNEEAAARMGVPVEELSKEGKAYALISAKAAEGLAEQKKMIEQYNVTGNTGETALKALQDKGFSCQYKILQGVRASKSGFSIEAADLPRYWCEKSHTASCHCRTFRVVFGIEPQPMGRPPESYLLSLSSTTLDRSKVAYSCHTAP